MTPEQALREAIRRRTAETLTPMRVVFSGNIDGLADAIGESLAALGYRIVPADAPLDVERLFAAMTKVLGWVGGDLEYEYAAAIAREYAAAEPKGAWVMSEGA